MSDTEDFSYVKRDRPLLWAPADGKCKWRLFLSIPGLRWLLHAPPRSQVDLTGVAGSPGAMTSRTHSCFPVQSVRAGPSRLIFILAKLFCK